MILVTLFKLSKLISHIQETSSPSAKLSFKTNNNSFSSSSSFNILRLTFEPVGFLAKLIIVGTPFIFTSSNLPLFSTNFDKASLIIFVSILYKLQQAIDEDPQAVADLIGANTIGSAVSNDNSFYFNSAMKGITKGGSYDVSYEIDASGNVINATIGGSPATYNANTKTLTVTDGDARGTAITVTDFTPNKKVTGTINIKDGAATNIANAITDMFLTDGDLTKLSEEIKSDIKETNSLIEAEEKNLLEEREKLLARFTAMDLRISQMNSQLSLLSSYIGLNSSG